MKGVVCARVEGSGVGPGEVGGPEGRSSEVAEGAGAGQPQPTQPRLARLVLQAVHEVYDLGPAGPWPAGEAAESRFVAIGRRVGRLPGGYAASVGGVGGGGGGVGV